MPAPTALLRRPEEVAEAANIPLPIEGMKELQLLRSQKPNRKQIRMMSYYLMCRML